MDGPADPGIQPADRCVREVGFELAGSENDAVGRADDQGRGAERNAPVSPKAQVRVIDPGKIG